MTCNHFGQNKVQGKFNVALDWTKIWEECAGADSESRSP